MLKLFVQPLAIRKLWQVLFLAIAIISIANAQTCRVDRILVNGTCVTCPTGLNRPLTMSQTGPCALTNAKCYTNTATGTICATGACKLPCGQSLACTQLTGLSCPVNQVCLSRWWPNGPPVESYYEVMLHVSNRIFSVDDRVVRSFIVDMMTSNLINMASCT
jgi:hypothetical protein